MARRFGGPNSPGGDPRPGQAGSAAPVRVRQRNPAGARINLLFLLPFAWAITAFFRDPTGLVLHLAIFALLILSAWLTREGVIAHAAYDARKVAQKPALPRKMLGAATMGLGLGLAAVVGMGPLQALILGALGGVLHLISFGLDPMAAKGMEGVDAFQADRVARAVAEAERSLAAIERAIARLNDRTLTDRIRDFAGQVRPLLRAVEDDPRQLGATRRYLGLYLTGAREASEKFADLQARRPDDSARADYLALLDDLQRNIAHRLDTLRDSDRQALDVEMEVLRERLAREGVRPALPVDDAVIDPLAQAPDRPADATPKGRDHG